MAFRDDRPDPMQAFYRRSSPASSTRWSLMSRGRYILVNVGANVTILSLLWLGAGWSLSRVLLWSLAVLAVGVLVHGWFWYPRAKRRVGGPAG